MGRKIIFYVSLFLSVIGILNVLFWDTLAKNSELLYYIIGLLNSYSFYSEIGQYFHTNSEGYSYSIDLINLFLLLTFLAGTVLYYFSDSRETRLLRFNFGLIFLSSLVPVIYSIIHFFAAEFTDIKSIKFLTLVFIFPSVLRLTFIYGSYKILQYLSKEQEFKTKEILEKESVISVLAQASLWKRFFHLITDSIFIYLIIQGFLNAAFYNEFLGKSLKSIESIFGEQAGLLILIVSARVLYYIPFEYFIGATLGKLLTQTRIVNDLGEKPSFKAFIIRTLCRFIPFEFISFFFKANWHDSFSETYVIEEQKKGVNGWVYFIVLLPIISGILVFSFYQTL